MDPPDRILRVDLSSRRVDGEPVPEEWLATYVGGKGLGARYLYAAGGGIDPESPANPLAFMTGPLTGYTPGEQRYAAITKSPLTGAFLDSYGGGTFPARLAASLGPHLGAIVTGAADEPVVLSLSDGEASVEPASDLWGLDAVETDERFPDAAVACVGPAGETAVRYATIASDGGDHHAGRGGAGAVMGSKRLKAVVARDPPPEPSGRLAALKAREEAAFADSDAGRWLAAGDTLETVDFANEAGVLPTRGWQESRFDGAEGIGVERAAERATGRERENDPVPGGFQIPEVDDETADNEPADDARSASDDEPDGDSVPRGATPIVLGAGLGIDDFDAVAALGGVCDRLGMDVISAGNAVAWAVRAGDEGLIDREVAFGDEAAARSTIEEIAGRKTPLGDALADGVAAAASRLGGGDLIPTVKGMELSSYDPRGAASMALAYATSDRGACHRRARPVEVDAMAPRSRDPDEVAAAVAAEQDRRAALWCLIADDFLEDVFDPAVAAEWLAARGYDHEPADLAGLGERVWTLTRLFNVREGFAREDDALPPAIAGGRGGAGEGDGNSPNRPDGLDPNAFDDLLDRYYAVREWDGRGRPTASLLDRLGLAGLADLADGVPSADEPTSTDGTHPTDGVDDR
ncbi:aldehyde ferredoxin oxidoreductase family protein [Halorubrum halodurans]|uniref:Aldehyde ferredoxin oxidoreductase n=1 Tax=Halorubrum halodurans TaxID=1383851 RepID=A0A256IN05_9EURY|nr:aldehyde ferredoxin oxidoreductase C-terminal domain-containing protein [Halorubrum halodurans]OYR57915.1 aldehyde ferredoxin oxidoreductase [Halorubrum halodurans]